jgi:hypothetical protein
MHLKFWRIAQPTYEGALGVGAGSPQAVDTAPLDAPAPGDVASASAPAESESLSDHEASFSPDAAKRADPDDERNEQGQFKPRHRAQSQRADADDVPAIAAQTKRIKDAEARLGADIVRQDGESERVYNLRRRAEILERQAQAPAPAKPPAAPIQPPQRPQQAIPQTFPAYDAFIAMQGQEEATYEDYVDARADWRYALQRAQERQRDAIETQQRTQAERGAAHQSRVTVARTKYPDFDAVVTNDAHIGPVLIDAILSSEHSADIAYYLGKNPTVRLELNAETPDYSVAAVNTTRRYLDSLVASQRSSSPSRAAAGPTGAALALVTPPAPRPPTPVRTGSIAAPDTPPGDDDMSLSSHEKHYSPRRR